MCLGTVFIFYKIKNNNILASQNSILFHKKLLNSDKSKLHYNNNILNVAVNVFKINNSFLNINIGDNGIKLAFFQAVKILYNTNIFSYICIYILVHSIYNVRPKSNLY